MTMTRSKLEWMARRRAPGYLRAALAMAKQLGPDAFELTFEQRAFLAERFPRSVGPGTALRQVIHAAVDAAPLPKAARQRVKDCPGCWKRATGLDRAYWAAKRAIRKAGARLMH